MPDDAEAFGAALLRVLDSPDLRRSLSEAALREMLRFSIDETAPVSAAL